MLRLGLGLRLQAMSGDLVNLPWCCHVHHIIRLHLNLVTRWQEGVETHDQVWVALEELRYAADHSWSVNTLRFKFLHYIQEVIVDLWLATKLQLHLVKVRQRILHLEALELLLPLHGHGWRGGVSVALHHLAPVGLHGGSVVVAAVHGRDGWPMAARALRHGRHLVAGSY